MASAQYNSNIYKRGRVTKAVVLYSLTAPDSKEGGNLSLPHGNEISQPEQVSNEVRTMSAPVATLEPKYWKLDGSFVLPESNVSSNLETGWWSSVMSDENGDFAEPLVIERVFVNVQTFNALAITFDAASNNYCTDFEAFFYGASGGLIYSERVSGNTSAYCRTSRAGDNVLRVVIKLFKTNEPHRYARITEIDYGVVLEYRDDVIQTINLVREAAIGNQAFPLPEFRLKILNNGLYDQLDSNSYAPYFQTRQRFEYRHGLVLPDGSTEWVNCGTYYLSDWSVSDKSVEFTAAGQSALLENSLYASSSFQEFTVAQLVNRILPQARITLDSPRITGYFGNTDYRRVLSMLAELSCCLVYENKNNEIMFDDIIGLSRGCETLVDANNEPVFDKNGAEILLPVEMPLERRLDYASNIFREPNVKLTKHYNAINLAEYTVSTEYRQISKTEQLAGEIAVYFSSPVIGEPEFEITEGFELHDVIVYTMYMTGRIVGSGTAELVIFGNAVTLTKSEVLYRAPWHTGREQDNPFKIDLPCMIRTENFAEFREWFLARRFELLHMRLETDVFWAQNPERELGELVSVQLAKNGKNGKSGNAADMIITRQELKYPALKGNTKLVGNVIMS